MRERLSECLSEEVNGVSGRDRESVRGGGEEGRDHQRREKNGKEQ